MASTPSGFAYVPSAPAAVRPTTASDAGAPLPLALRALSIAVAIVCLAAGLAIASAYPILPFAAMGLFVAWTIFATLRPALALPALCAAVPAIGFATWTGWLTVEETDLVVLATSAGGYAALALGERTASGARSRFAPRLSVVSIALIGLFLASTLVALLRGVDAAGGLHRDAFDWTAGYESAQNGLRIFKSFAAAVLLAPLLARELRKPGGTDRFGAGMTVSLALGALLVLRERLAFTGLLDFSDDYRVTGGFWEMHVGGAALDGFLALTIPFAVREAVRRAGRPDPIDRARFVAAGAILVLAAYACLVTFSRGVYAAVPLCLATLLVASVRQRVGIERGGLWLLLAKALLFAVVIAGCGFVVFRHGGYRAVLAAFVVLAAAMPVDTALRRLDSPATVAAVVAAILVATMGHFAATILPKGPYVVFAIASVGTAAAAIVAERNPARAIAACVVAGWLWLVAAAVDVASNWGGPAALHDSAVVLAGFVVLVFAAARLPRSVWPAARHQQLATVAVAAVVLGVVAVFAAGAYMGGRFATSRGDLDERLAHWSEGIGRLHGSDWLLGKGLGRFPATSLFESNDGTGPGSYLVRQRDGETFLALTAPRIRYIGFNEYFRLSQRVAIQPHRTYTVEGFARTAQATYLHVEVCEKQLLYQIECKAGDLSVAPDPGWQRIRFPFDSGTIGASGGALGRPIFFAMGSGSPATTIDVRSIRLVGPDGVDLLANGRFADHTTHWFSSSDRIHLPWHIKNLALDVLFDQGLVGLILFVALVAGALLRTTLGRACRHPDAPFVAAAIVGYLVVGAFDSLLDVPRVALLFYLVVLVGLMLRNPRVASAPVAAPRGVASTPAWSTPASSTPASSTRASSTPASSTPASSTSASSTPASSTPASSTPGPSLVDAAERAARRRRAFGERKRDDPARP